MTCRSLPLFPRFGVLAVCLLFALTLVATACAPANQEPQPPEIAYGHDMCDICGMLVSDPRYAAALLLDNGQALKFDDTGEMFVYHDKHPEQAVRAWFVHDYNTEQWVRGESAYYVVSTQIQSPMGFGVAAFGERSAAETFAQRIGVRVLTFDEARTTNLKHSSTMTD